MGGDKVWILLKFCFNFILVVLCVKCNVCVYILNSANIGREADPDNGGNGLPKEPHQGLALLG